MAKLNDESVKQTLCTGLFKGTSALFSSGMKLNKRQFVQEVKEEMWPSSVPERTKEINLLSFEPVIFLIVCDRCLFQC